MTTIESDPETFKREWAEMIGLYRIVASDTPMAVPAREALASKLAQHRLNLSINVLLRASPSDVLDRLAPKYLLTRATLPSGPFGPAVTADSPEHLTEMMQAMKNDPRLAGLMAGSAWLTPTPARG
jgi:hypothetical protein